MFVTIPLSPGVKRQMDTVDDFLNLIEKEKLNTFIAGGAPRDWFFNRRAKDIDIFLPPMDVVALSNLLKDKYDIINTYKLSEDVDESYRSPNLLGVIDFRYDNIPFQFIIQVDNTPVYNHFGCSLSLISYEKYNIIPTDCFMQSLQRGEIVFLNSCNTTYIKKNINKFPSFSVQFISRLMSIPSPSPFEF